MEMPNLSAWALQHRSLVRFFIGFFMVAGIFSYSHLGQMEDPEFTIKVMIVQAFWQGASAEEVEKQVTDKLEKKLQETPYLDIIKSYSKPGESTIFVQLKDSTLPKFVPETWYQVRKKINDIKHTLPSGVDGPYFNDEFGDTFGSIYAFTADGFSYAELKDYVDNVRQELLSVPDVSKVNLIGVQDEKIYIEFSHVKLSSLHIDPALIINTLQAQNAITPSGTVETDSDRVYLRVSGDFTSTESVSNIGIEVNGHHLKLGDIANVYRNYVDPTVFKMRFKGEEAIGLAISMKKGGDVIRLGQALQTTMARLINDLPIGIEVHQVSDQPRVVGDSVHDFMKVLTEAIIIVLVVSFLSLGLRTGLVVALSIPLVLAITFLLMYFFGINLQRISLGALIIALGLLVDDAMISVEMMALKLEQGWDRFRAATFAYTSTAFPMLTGTLITAAGFLPVGMAKSSAGEYTFSIFAVVTIALLVSWVVAVVFIPYLGYILLPEIKTAHAHEHDVYQTRFYRILRAIITGCVHYRKTVILLTIIAFGTGIYCFRFVEQQFFPSSNRPELLVDIYLPEGASFYATEKQLLKLEAMLKSHEDVHNYVSYTGGGSPRFYLPMDLRLQNTNYAQIVIMTKGMAARERVITQLREAFVEQFPEIRGRVTRLENGPPVGYPVQFRVMGENIEKVRVIALQVAEIMRQNPNTHDVHLDWNEKTKAVRLEVDQDKARSLGISSQQLSSTLNTLLRGIVITEYREKDELIEVIGRAVAEERGNLANLDNLNIYLNDGKFVPLSQICTAKYGFEEGIIWRRNRFPTMTVRADISDKVQAPDISVQINPTLDKLRAQLPPGYRIEMGGAIEESSKSQASIAAVMPFMLMVILVLLMIQLQSLQRTVLVLLTAPLGIIGLTLFLIVFQRPFGFVAMLGAISLMGMIMRNSVILIDQIEQDRAAGMPAWTAIVESTVRRFRPIMLTAAAAILAMIPLSHNNFWGPMAIAIMGGLLVATIFTLFFLPALYAAWFRVKKPILSQ